MPKFCANLTMLYGEHQFLDRFRAAAHDGFAAVEYMIKRVARHQRNEGIADQGMGPGIGDHGSGI